uniref:Phorbol-ester/DAG-type domain-containing protein n=1 Tax=Ciona savignyi TaxID=51511 RepID=H2YFY0_CIOSA
MEGDLERNNHILGDRWESMMSGHMTRIANEKGLDAQNFRCADCTSPIGIFYGAPRLCWYTGEYYCQNCHLMEENMIPARIIHNWDFRKHKVSKRTMVYLTQQWRDPCIQMDEVNPSGYRYIDELKKLLPLRLQLATLEPYLQTCRMLTPELLSTRLKGLHHMLGNPHIYSPHDLCLVRDGLLYNAINKLVQFGTKHVRQCALCTAKGFVCEICGKDEIIFAFDDMTSQCQQCKGVFHKRCFADRCPRCERRHNRNTPL